MTPAELTLRELLRHTGGLPDYVADPAYAAAVEAQPGRPWDLERILAVGLAPDRSARGEFRYSNVGYWLAGAAIEDATGETLAAVLSALVFAPAGMDSTFYPRPSYPRPGHPHSGEGVTEGGYDTRWAGPAGAAWSSPADLLSFLDAVYGGGLIRPESLAAMTAPTPVAAEPPWRRPGYGLGLMIDEGLGVAGHGGDGPSYRSAAFRSPRTGRSAAVVVRAPSGLDPTGLALRLLRPG